MRNTLNLLSNVLLGILQRSPGENLRTYLKHTYQFQVPSAFQRLGKGGSIPRRTK